MLKNAYKYDSQTKEFLSVVQVQESPLEKDVWLMPADCTLDEPMEKQEHKTPCYKNGAWVLVADYRKCDFYDKATQEKHTITELGVIPQSDWTDKVPTDPEMVWNGTDWELPQSVVIDRKKKQVRDVRDNYIDDIEWRVDRYKDQREMGMETTDDEVEYHKVLAYMQYLRDYPTSGATWYENNPLTWDEWRERSNEE